MINRINSSLSYNRSEITHLASLKPHQSAMWDSPPDDNIIALKSKIRGQLLSIQNSICAYCGLDLGGTSEGQIEHIAPKAKYPDFTFEKKNLAMACHHCNGFSKKGNHHTISNKVNRYSSCSFKLVHPYFDDPSLHYGWVSQNKKVIIKALSSKGTYSIKMLKLNNLKMAELRGKKVIADIVIASQTTPQIDDQLIQSVINYK
jgi:uncharacterized protein (TIGR02646 family)